MPRPKLVVILGPTAVGKTGLSIQLAKALRTEIISADSRQFYKEIGIGTAKPTLEEMDGVAHHFVDFLALENDYSAGRFEKEVLDRLSELFARHRTVLMCGGSGLFIRAVTEGLDDIPHDPTIREELNQQFQTEGIDALQKELHTVDPVAFDRIDIKNPHRLIRALEVCRSADRPYSDFLNHSPAERPFDILMIGLRRERDELYRRIEQRTELMLAEGWIEECRSVMDKRHLNALNTVGYKEIFQYLDGEIDVDECSRLIKQRTRNMAKRQMTYFRGMADVHWVDLADETAVEGILQYIEKT